MTDMHHHRVIQIDFSNRNFLMKFALFITFFTLWTILCCGFGAVLGMKFKGPTMVIQSYYADDGMGGLIPPGQEVMSVPTVKGTSPRRRAG